jgi:hypothetical protein
VLIRRFLPRWLLWIDGTWPFLHVRRGHHVAGPTATGPATGFGCTVCGTAIAEPAYRWMTTTGGMTTVHFFCSEPCRRTWLARAEPPTP